MKYATHVFHEHTAPRFDCWKALAVATITQAVRDLHEENTAKALDAALWLVSDDFPLFAEVVGLPFADGIQFITSGRARTMKDRIA